VITDDKPRTESPGDHRRGHRRRAFRPDIPIASSTIAAARIRDTLVDADRNDVVVVIAGKGHEDYQLYGDERRKFSDQKVVAAALAAASEVRHEPHAGRLRAQPAAASCRAPTAPTAACPPTRARSRRASCSSRCAAAIQRQRFRRGRRGRRRRGRRGRHARRPAAAADRGARHAEALTQGAAAWRAQFSYPIVGVAGSNGKTTVKEMIAAILERRGRRCRRAAT
jgi:UDP-N-acetylmuramyl tripeptide synthase